MDSNLDISVHTTPRFVSIAIVGRCALNLDGFHITDHAGHVGSQASASSIERSTPVIPVGRDAWKYNDSIPVSARILRNFYGYDAIETLTTRYRYIGGIHVVDIPGWSEREAKQRQRKSGWRYRRDNTTKRVEYYLYDLLVTDWSYLRELPGNEIDPELISEATAYQVARRTT